MKQIIVYLDKKSIGYLDSALPDNIDMNNPAKYPEFSKRLSQVWRECKGAPEKQTQLAKWLGFAQPTVNNWINGNALPGLETAVMLANKFDCNPIWLITGNGSKYLSEELKPNGYLKISHLPTFRQQEVEAFIRFQESQEKITENNQNKPLTTEAENVEGGG